MTGSDRPKTALIQSGTRTVAPNIVIWNGKLSITMNSSTSHGEFRNIWVAQ